MPHTTILYCTTVYNDTVYSAQDVLGMSQQDDLIYEICDNMWYDMIFDLYDIWLYDI